MAGRPPGGPRAGQSHTHDDLLLDLDNEQPVYSQGQRSTLNDDDLLRNYNQPHDSPGRPSVSYDDFVGATGMHESPGRQPGAGTGPHPSSRLDAAGPYMTRQYSQTSELGNYQRYADDLDDYPSDRASYYQNDGASTIGGPANAARQAARNRNSVLSLGGGFLGRFRNRMSRGQGYSEMDLPLTEGGHDRVNGAPPSQQKQAGGGGGGGFDLGNFKFGFGSRKPDPSTLGPRIIYLNNPPANAENKYVDNHISTAKYNFASFLPKFLFEQFSKVANVFFLFTAALQQIPGLSPTNRYTTIAPLLIVLLISAGKELVEDYRRKQADNALNTSKAQVLRGSSFTQTKWINVAVGDVVRVESEEPFPADLVLLASSEPEGLCYIETANLDGETNLKIKQGLPETSTMVSPSELSRLTGRIKSEQPNSSLYTYEATLTMQSGGGERELALNPEQLLLRGATLRNTPWIHGVVVFTGHETKLMRNATATPIKRTKVERQVNSLVLILVGMLLVLSACCTVGDLVTRQVSGNNYGYLYLDRINGVGIALKTFFKDMVTYWVLFSALVPISLFVTVELVKYWHAILINDDLDMYYDKTDTPATCRTSSLVEELGMVEYVFSDKTGTLTCNMMEFKQISIGGIMYSDNVPEDRRATGSDDMEGIHDFKQLRSNLAERHSTAEAIDHFLALLATCHTVIPEVDEKGRIKYQAASPDEATTVGGNRADELDKAAEIIEHDLTLLGATAIEDRLQDGVPETIHTLQEANIKVWVLTGDRQETAINIGMSCKLLSEDMMLLIVNEETAEGTRDNVQKKLDAIRTQGDGTIEMETLALFRYLRKLLLVHGAWSYQRISKTILFSFYKNIALYLTQFWYAFQNVFSGQVIYESWTLSFYNVFYTVFPPLAIGILDQFISARLLDRYPQLYTMGQQNLSFKIKVFWQWIANAVYHSIVLYVFSELIWYDDLIQGDGKTAGHWVWGTALYGAVLLTVLGKAALVTNNWTKYHVMAIPGSMAVWYIFIAAYGTVAPMIPISVEYHGVVPRLYTSPIFWLQTIALAGLCLLRDFAWKYAKRMYRPQTYHHIQEIQKYNIQDYRPRMEQFQKAIRKVRQVQRMRKQRGYAFSQADESQTRVLQAYDTTKNRGRYGEMASSRPQ
ncbi:putative phospholipid-transporting ATPase DRS2 [Beauveria bassiana]|nr:putative phospholipid-transporting ATPase DRS2 [Beauveria bassiana]